ncbi:MAG TPA: TlpA family protein disulfide reductase [Nannocystis exedens]|nr:TlpA family protein disulfide reductase [Nannocystis exedens]
MSKLHPARLALISPWICALLACSAAGQSGREASAEKARSVEAKEAKEAKDAKHSSPDPAPDFRGKDLRGQDFALADLRGDVVLLNVWASWCEPCKEELPELAKLQRERGPEGLQVIGVSIDALRTQHTVRQLAQEFKVPYPIIFDPQSTIVPAMKIVGYPTTFIIGRDGAIRWRRDGLIERDDPELARELKAALNTPKLD